ncbi:MAG: MHS family MFS transporter [Reyranella sp.]|jgi:MFS family permease|uniref:MFS transporter n=1 Tax=Reyranella sp. TaxID=1929291 RepID=UPI00095C0719|nr:MFS transporter [Reyranella sp.]MBN9542038.1 MHS family MFS transporter [Alphaproteobacteria bacterium]MBR2813384.1 MHS family MFS transporter [Reyranella sp.]OJU40682.1 MAG: MFS transporter [Alphaproteobacteria bacterium 65-37]
MTATAKGTGKMPVRVIVAASVGSALEWYDFFLYGTAAALVFGELFFPKSDPLVGTLLSFLTFGVGFVVRPLGGILFGIMGDRYGRKPVLVITLLMIGIGTTLIGLLPTYAQIGYWAPILLVLLRVVQGLGAGAEYGGAVIYLVENAPAKHRGFWGGFAPLGVSVGNLMAAGAFALVTMLPREELMAWGWRVPFLASILLIAVGIYVRLRVTETPVYTEAVVARNKVESNPAMAALQKHPRNFMVVLGARLAENGLGYLFPVWGLSYVISLGVSRADALSALMVAFVVELFTILGFAALSDRVGRRPVYMFGALAGVALAFPFFWLVETKQWIYIALAFILARAVVTAAMFGPQASYFAELFPPQRRFAGFAFARELGSLLAGGPAPFLATALVAWASGAWWPVAIYAIVLSLLTAWAIWAGPETYEDSITSDNSQPSPAPAQPARA